MAGTDYDIDLWEDYFPYTPRPLQETMLKVITRMLERNTHMVIEAANGTGKTIAALASVIPYARRNRLKVVYMARTHSQMDRVMQELQEISKNRPISGIALRGRGSMCLNEMVNKHAKNNQAVQEMCRQLKTANKCEYYNNMKNEKNILPVVQELKRVPATAEYIFELAEAAHICPAETARKILPDMDVIACSYLYLFEPDIRMSFLETIQCEMEDLILVIDEAHNLPEMVNSITSDEISTFSFNRAVREARNNARDDFVQFMDGCLTYLMNKNKQLKPNREVPVDPAVFLEEIQLSIGDMELDDEFFIEMVELGNTIRNKMAKRGKEPRSSLGRIGEFFYRWFESIGRKEYTHSVEKKMFSDSSDTFMTLRLNSLDPSKGVLPVLEHVNNSLHISGTIGDPEAYMMLTGMDKLDTMANILPSPYQSRSIKSLVVKGLTTQYRQRSAAMWTKMVHSISAVVKETPVNVGIFTPSYSILRELKKHGLERRIIKPILYAKSGMSSAENDQMVRKFKNYADKGGAVLCSVLGGRSSEGADFPGDLMNSVIVIGIPYAPPNCRVDAQIKYLDSKFPGQGRTLSYIIPAINRASQAAGRPVRGLDDRAFILLLDYRFAMRNVSVHLPEWLRSSMEMVDYDPQFIGREVRSFFQSHDMF